CPPFRPQAPDRHAAAGKRAILGGPNRSQLLAQRRTFLDAIGFSDQRDNLGRQPLGALQRSRWGQTAGGKTVHLVDNGTDRLGVESLSDLACKLSVTLDSSLGLGDVLKHAIQPSADV